MKLADTIDNSIFCSIGCITEQDNILTLEEYLTYNFNVISKFNKIVIAHTKTENITNSQFGEYCNVWKKLFNDKCIIIERPNLGHTFGFTDLDNTVINEAKRFNPTFIWKSTNDV